MEKGRMTMGTKTKETKVVNGKEVEVMQWPTTENKDKSWGTSGYDRHYIK